MVQVKDCLGEYEYLEINVYGPVQIVVVRPCEVWDGLGNCDELREWQVHIPSDLLQIIIHDLGDLELRTVRSRGRPPVFLELDIDILC